MPSARGSKNPNRTITLVVVAALVSALLGGAIGDALAHKHPAPAAAPPAASSGPASGPASGATLPTTPSAGGNGNGNSGGATTPAPSTPITGNGNVDSAGVAAKVIPGVVDINTRLSYQSAAAAGTGMVLTADGEILTNNHVVAGATSISVTVPSTGRTYTASVVGTAPTLDVAVLKLQGASGLSTVPLGNSDSVSPGDEVVAMGNAGGVGGAPSVVTGVVQAVGQTITASDQGGANAETLHGLIEHNAPIAAGDSGGPLANAKGQVIGVDTAASVRGRFSNGASAAFAIPINQALSIAKQIETGPATSTIHLGLPGFLGIGLSSTTSRTGALITGVASGTPAASAGMAAGDTITAINGTVIGSAQDLTAALRGHHGGDRITLTWTDSGGATHHANITLIAGPAD